MYSFKKRFLVLPFVATLLITGCGGGGSSSSNDDPNNQQGNSTVESINKIDDIDRLKPYLGLARKLVTGKQKSSCLPTGDGGGKIISQVYTGSSIQFSYEEFDNESCSGDATIFKLSYYSIVIGNTIDGGKALEADLKFDHGYKIVDKVPNHMLGLDDTNTFYTTIVAYGDESKNEIKMGIAKPNGDNDGSTPEKRASDTSDYRSGKYYFSN